MITEGHFVYFSLDSCYDPHVMTPHLNRLIEMVQILGHNINYALKQGLQKLSLIITKYSLLSGALLLCFHCSGTTVGLQ